MDHSKVSTGNIIQGANGNAYIRRVSVRWRCICAMCKAILRLCRRVRRQAWVAIVTTSSTHTGSCLLSCPRGKLECIQYHVSFTQQFIEPRERCTVLLTPSSSVIFLFLDCTTRGWHTVSHGTDHFMPSMKRESSKNASSFKTTVVDCPSSVQFEHHLCKTRYCTA